MKWDPPPWWDTNDSPKSSSDCDQIKAAYVRAETCVVCLNSIWPTGGATTSISSLVSSAEKACAGCMILSSILKAWGAHTGSKSSPAASWIEWYRKQTQWLFLCNGERWEIYVPKDVFENGITTTDGLLPPSQPRPWHVPQLPRELEISLNTGSKHAVKRALSWMQDCEENHEICRDTDSKLPSRVLLIQGPEDVVLYESAEEVERYVCLSHCWGKLGTVAKTTTSTLDRYKQGIPWHELPLTFQEAISFTFRLGFRYLWIDSLCIQQDSIEDWRIEGSKMAQIYSGAHVTLAAAAAECSSSGCFRQIPQRPSTACSYLNSDGSELEVHIRPRIEGHAWIDESLPLLRRGWTLQECLLSRRLINFTDEELVWGCRTKTACECTSLDDFYFSRNMRSPQRFTELFQTSAEGKPYLWYHIVKAYSNLHLSFEKDVFPALQGISKQMHQYKKSKYMAGLWESSIIPDLLWYIKRPKEVTRPQQWRAPSWSWASVIGPVDWDLRPRLLPRCTYVTAHVVPAGEDAFGEILSAKITLLGRCLQQDVEGLYDPTTERHSRIEYPEQSWSQEFWPDAREDCWPEETDSTRPHSTPLTPGEHVKTLLISKEVEWGTIFTFLILRSIDKANNIYERIGLMEISRKYDCSLSDLRMGEEETIHIV